MIRGTHYASLDKAYDAHASASKCFLLYGGRPGTVNPQDELKNHEKRMCKTRALLKAEKGEVV